MTTRRFEMEDQLRFGALSGDLNPLHVDPLAARRSMLGGVAVHGIHLLLWALDELPVAAFSKLRVHFDRGVLVGDPVRVEWREEEGRFVGRVNGEAGTLVRINLTAAEPAAAWAGSTELSPVAPVELDLESLAGRSGEFELALPDDWRAMFPRLAQRFSASQAAFLLGTTRLVGTICPGLHSIYSGLQLTCDAPPDQTMRWRVTRSDPRVRIVDLEVASGGVKGTVMAVLRPKPFQQPSLATLAGAVPANAFAGQEALVVGGSRGLGELAAKLLAAGGARVTITWRQGEAEALAIVREAEALGLSIRAQRFDTADPPSSPPPESPYTHLYYFATPKIPAGRPGHFQPAVLLALLDAYVGGFARTAAWFTPRAAKDAVLWYPSTVLIDEPDDHFAEYIVAKTCGETLCAQLAPRRVVVERLPRLATDQTQSVTELAVSDSVAVLRTALLRALHLFST